MGRACLEDILSHEDKDGHRLCGKEYCPLHRAMITGVTTSVPVIVFALHKNGTRVPTMVTTAPIRNDAGEHPLTSVIRPYQPPFRKMINCRLDQLRPKIPRTTSGDVNPGH